MNISGYDIARGNCVPRPYINHEAPEFTDDELEQWAEGNLDLEGLPSFDEAQEEGTGNCEVDGQRQLLVATDDN